MSGKMGSYQGWGWRATDFCSHQWADPDEPPISRTPYVPIIGDGPRQMKRGRTYQCRHCKATLTVPFEGDPVACQRK
jgi:hypothetical protein